ncbi:MAG: helix-turn-helix transcriptional regulator [Bacteroidetes bacterium]|nr:helix-turn-helix transcriptional regulator [Bacteroidota bacterium]
MSNYFGQRVRELRDKKSILLRQIAAHLEVDTALISKLEKGDRNPNKEQVIKIAEFLNIQTDDLLTLWLADKVESAVANDKNLASNAMNIVKNKIKIEKN